MPAYQRVTIAEARKIQGPRPGTRALYETVLAHYFARGLKGGGIYNNRTIRGSRALSTHAAGRGADFMVPNRKGEATPEGLKLGDELFLRLISAAEALSICEIIWQNKRWTTEGVKHYRPNNHHDHVHAAQTIDGASQPDTPNLRKWYAHFLWGR
jgi:hypothetical protein